MIYSNFTGNDYSISSDNTSNQCYYTTTSSSYPDYAQLAAHIGEYITYLRCNNDLISTDDDLVVKQDLADEVFYILKYPCYNHFYGNNYLQPSVRIIQIKCLII